MWKRALSWIFLGLALSRGVWADGIALLVPAYFSPNSARWHTMATAAPRVPIVAIANVFNGPGTGETPRAEYSRAINELRAAGGQVIGYIYTQYGKRPLDTVRQDMLLWHRLYSLDGFFVDEVTNTSEPASLDYYAELLRYARELNPNYRVTINPGTNTQEPYLKRPTADVAVIFEHHEGYPTFAPSAWTKRYPEFQFAHLTYAVPENQLTNFVSLAVERRAGFVYITNDSGNNPWDTLPAYWEEEVNLIEALNRAAAERVQSKLTLRRSEGPLLSLSADGAVGRYVLETASPLGDWQPASTNVSNNGTSVWQLLNIPPNRFFRLKQE